MNKAQLPKAIIFDWDNTLVDTWPLIFYSINKMLKKMGHKEWSEEQVKSKTHLSMRDYFPELFGDKWQEAGKIYVDAYHEKNLEKLEFLPNAVDFLNLLNEKNIKLFVISNKRGPTLRAEAVNFGVADKFIKIIGSHDAKEDKPSPKVVDFTLDGTNLDPKNDLIWFIGDSEVDLQCAINSGCAPILFGEGQNIDQKLKEKSLYFKDHKELIEYIDNL
ncbi:HAD family hydrolase [Rickettsiales bacterium]|nr:HAD family hydrolase [Rickettsiales bacterium]MDB2550283.1 HAD family hydrolase [Rickettsiales bacterium]